MVLLAPSCKPIPDPVLNPNDWLFQSVVYKTNTCVPTDTINFSPGLDAETTAPTNPNSSASVLMVWFADSTTVTTGTYFVANQYNAYSLQSNQAVIFLDIDVAGSFSTYTSTGGNGSNQILNVTVTNGKMKITGSNIMLQNTDFPFDSSALRLNIHQTN